MNSEVDQVTKSLMSDHVLGNCLYFPGFFIQKRMPVEYCSDMKRLMDDFECLLRSSVILFRMYMTIIYNEFFGYCRRCSTRSCCTIPNVIRTNIALQCHVLVFRVERDMAKHKISNNHE